MDSNYSNGSGKAKEKEDEESGQKKELFQTGVTLDNFMSTPQVDDEDIYESDDEDDEGKPRDAACINRAVLGLQHGVVKAVGAVNEKFGGHFHHIIFLILYVIYFIYAMCYEFGSEPSVRLLWATLLGFYMIVRHKLGSLLKKTSCVRWFKKERSPTEAKRFKTMRFFTRWLLYGGVGAFMAYVIVDVAIKDASKLRSIPGIIVFPLICFLFSSSPSRVNWHTVYWSMGLQFILAVLVMRSQGGKTTVLWVQDRLDEFFDNSKPASKLMFGETYLDHYMIFGALPIVFLTNAALTMLYYLGAMQVLVKALGTALHFILQTSAIESTGVASSIFMEGASALLGLRPYLNDMTSSELFALSTSCLSSIGGAFLAILTQIGIPVEFLLPAMVISAPATFTVCKLVVPETRKQKKIKFGAELPPEMQYSSIIEAAQAGAISVVSVVANVVVSAYAFLALISWANNTCTWFGDRVGLEQLTMEKIMSYLFYPFSLLMGVELDDCRSVAMLMGYRLTASNFVALLKMATLVANRYQFQQYTMNPNATITYSGDHIILDQANITLIDGYISKRSEAIATYSLCGFSGILSLFITLGVTVTLIPQRRRWITSVAAPMIIAGNMANFMVGCFAGLLVD